MSKAAGCSSSQALTVQAAAAELHNLINTRPTLPHVHEIEAIVAKVAAAPPQSDVVAVQQLDEFRRRKRALLAYFDRPEPVQDDDPVAKRLENELDAFVFEVWAKPPLTWADVLLRGEVALYHENGVLQAACEPDAYLDEKAAAQLIDAIITVGRRVLGQADDGRREGDV